MKALAWSALLLSLVTLAAGVEPGRACSCAPPDPRAALAQSDGAFVGRLVARRDAGQRAVLTFSVERALKGSIGSTIEVLTASNSAACGLELQPDTRVGLALDRRGGTWHGHLCTQFDPEELLAAALPLPAPNGRGPVALVVGGEFGDVRLIALDARGRTLAYGRGGGRAGLISVCPGRQRLLELAFVGSGTTLVVRQLPTLRIVRRHATTLPGSRHPTVLACRSRPGTSAVVFARGPGDSPAKAALYRLRNGRRTALWSGAAFDAGFSSSAAYLSAGMTGRSLLRIDLDDGRANIVATLPGPTTSLAVNRSGTALAGVHSRIAAPSQVVRIDLRRRPGRVAVARLAREVSGQVFWLRGGRSLFVPAYGGSAARVLDDALRTRSHFRWTAGMAALADGVLFGTDHTRALFSAELPSGPQRVVRRLPGRPSVIVAANA